MESNVNGFWVRQYLGSEVAVHTEVQNPSMAPLCCPIGILDEVVTAACWMQPATETFPHASHADRPKRTQFRLVLGIGVWEECLSEERINCDPPQADMLVRGGGRASRVQIGRQRSPKDPNKAREIPLESRDYHYCFFC